MDLLLDTCTFLWLVDGSERLSKTARELFSDPSNAAYLSSVSAWEIAVKSGLGSLSLAGPPDRFVPSMRERHGIAQLTLDEEACLHVSKLPRLHRDPFDRMLICQAMIHNLALLTPDPMIQQYPVRSIW